MCILKVTCPTGKGSQYYDVFSNFILFMAKYFISQIAYSNCSCLWPDMDKKTTVACGHQRVNRYTGRHFTHCLHFFLPLQSSKKYYATHKISHVLSLKQGNKVYLYPSTTSTKPFKNFL